MVDEWLDRVESAALAAHASGDGDGIAMLTSTAPPSLWLKRVELIRRMRDALGVEQYRAIVGASAQWR